MSGFNLPPGCSLSDIPGNSAADAAYEKLFDDVESALKPLTPPNLAASQEDPLEKVIVNIVELINAAFNDGYKQAMSDVDEAKFYAEQSKGEEYAP